MTTLLPASDATNAAATEGDVKDFLTNLRDYMADFLGTDSTNKGAALALLGAALNGSISKTTAYTVVSADRGKVINCTGTFTLTLQAAATLGDGFVFAVRNIGTGTITVDPNLAETINGQQSVVVGASSMKLFYCDGSGFAEIGSAAGGGAQVFTSSGTFTWPVGVSMVRVYAIGGGGGGGYATANRTGGGGGSGGSCLKYLSGVTGGTEIAVTVGNGGGYATSGGNSSFGSHCVAYGGAAGASNVMGAASGGAGGGAVGDVVTTGNAGGSASHSYVAPDGKYYGGNGASSEWWVTRGIGGIGGYGYSDQYGGNTGSNGSSASGIGAGGGGASGGGQVSTRYGGTGAPGLVVVEW